MFSFSVAILQLKPCICELYFVSITLPVISAFIMDQASVTLASISAEVAEISRLPRKAILVRELKFIDLKMKKLDTRVKQIRWKEGPKQFQTPPDMLRHRQELAVISKLRAELSEEATKPLAQLITIKALERQARQKLNNNMMKVRIEMNNLDQRVVMLREQQQTKTEQKDMIQKEIDDIERAQVELLNGAKMQVQQLVALKEIQKKRE
jgi:hypothetical protein